MRESRDRRARAAAQAARRRSACARTPRSRTRHSTSSSPRRAEARALLGRAVERLRPLGARCAAHCCAWRARSRISRASGASRRRRWRRRSGIGATKASPVDDAAGRRQLSGRDVEHATRVVDSRRGLRGDGGGVPNFCSSLRRVAARSGPKASSAAALAASNPNSTVVRRVITIRFGSRRSCIDRGSDSRAAGCTGEQESSRSACSTSNTRRWETVGARLEVRPHDAAKERHKVWISRAIQLTARFASSFDPVWHASCSTRLQRGIQ